MTLTDKLTLLFCHGSIDEMSPEEITAAVMAEIENAGYAVVQGNGSIPDQPVLTPKSAIPEAGDAGEERNCPFDCRLARTPYLVIPKLALQAMPMDWRYRFEALLAEADEAGLETPEYHVFREGGPYTSVERSDSEDEYSPIQELFVLRSDPWANYRHAGPKDVLALCPTFKATGAQS